MPLILAECLSVRNELENWSGRETKDLRIVSTCDLSHYDQMIMVESGIGVAMVMDFDCADERLCMRSIEPEMRGRCVLVWRKGRILSPLLTRFIAHVKSSLECV